MKKFLLAVLCLAAVGCAEKERYVKTAEAVQPKVAMLRVDGIANVMVGLILDADDKGNLQFHVEFATRPVSYLGSVVFITPSGVLLTCAHMFDMVEVDTITATLSDGKIRRGKLLNQDVDRDLAIVKTDGYNDYASLSTDGLRIGQEVLAVGNPHGLQFSTSHGIVSALDRDLNTGFYFTQTDAPINPGNSGGPLFSMDGDLIGINARGWQASDGLGFAVAPEVIADYLRQFRGI